MADNWDPIVFTDLVENEAEFLLGAGCPPSTLIWFCDPAPSSGSSLACPFGTTSVIQQIDVWTYCTPI
ncbi:MAG: hypothetical protein R2781_02740 [Flavobacteriaceae bacterium]